MKRALCCLVVFMACARPAVPPAATIQSPADGWMGSGPVKLTLAATGTTIAPVAEQRPGGAHFHLFLNVDPTAEGAPIPSGNPAIIHLGGGQTEYTYDSLPANSYRVIVVLADNAHVPLPGQKTDTINFMIH
jgi:Domain of unknown function (DUF4399)